MEPPPMPKGWEQYAPKEVIDVEPDRSPSVRLACFAASLVQEGYSRTVVAGMLRSEAQVVEAPVKKLDRARARARMRDSWGTNRNASWNSYPR